VAALPRCVIAMEACCGAVRGAKRGRRRPHPQGRERSRPDLPQAASRRPVLGQPADCVLARLLILR
jgi:hypothetical protein